MMCVARAVMVLILVAPGLLSVPRSPAADRPNIVLIMADDVGCEVLGSYGGSSYATPHLDALAQQGLRFTHCYAMPVCHPTRVCLLTGRYPRRLGNPGWGSFPEDAESQTFASLLKQKGYATAIAGKWQLALLREQPDHPHRLGFEESCLFGWHEGPRYYDPLIYQNGKPRDDTAGRYGPDVYTEFLIDFIERHQDRPFLAFYSMALCHDVTDDLPRPVPFGPHGRYDSYEEMALAMDQRVGRLTAAIDRLGLSGRTLVLFTSDNGTARESIYSAVDGEFVRRPVFSTIDGKRVPGGKGSLTDGGTRVPLIARWPGVVPEDRTADDLVDFSDFFTTFLDMAGAPAPAEVTIDGRSFADRLRGEGPGRRDWVYAQRKGRFWVRNQRWKLLDDGQLFDLQSDPSETAPVSTEQPSAAATAARRELSRAMQQLVASWPPAD